MKTTTPAFDAYLIASSTRFSTCLKLTATDGTVLGFTNSTRAFNYDGVNYQAATGQTPTAVESSSSLSIDNLDIETIRNIDAITGPDILRGRWDFADCRLFLINPLDTAAGILRLRRGTVGQISMTRQKLTAEIRGMMDALTKQVLELYSPGCRVDVGSPRCGITLNAPVWAAATAYTVRQPFDALIGSVVRPSTQNRCFFKCVTAGTSSGSEPSWNTTLGATTTDGTVTWEAIAAYTLTGTVTGIATAKRNIETDLTEDTDYFTGGLLTWLTGLNAGGHMEVKSHLSAAGRINLVLPMWFAIEVGDTFSISAGCFKRVIDCKDKWNNTYNMQAEPYVQQNFKISPARIDQNVGGK